MVQKDYLRPKAYLLSGGDKRHRNQDGSTGLMTELQVRHSTGCLDSSRQVGTRRAGSALCRLTNLALSAP
jgi:hypothetical protein